MYVYICAHFYVYFMVYFIIRTVMYYLQEKKVITIWEFVRVELKR